MRWVIGSSIILVIAYLTDCNIKEENKRQKRGVMDSDSEVRAAILALVQAHWSLMGLYRATNQTIEAACRRQPDLGGLRREIANVVQREREIAEQQAISRRSP